MSIFIGGCIALILGILGIIIWWWHFLAILQGVIPIMLIFAGALAVYLSIDQVKAWKSARDKKSESVSVPVTPATATEGGDDVEALRKENEELKKKLEEQDKTTKKGSKAAAKAEEGVEKVEETLGEIVENAATAETEVAEDADAKKDA